MINDEFFGHWGIEYCFVICHSYFVILVIRAIELATSFIRVRMVRCLCFAFRGSAFAFLLPNTASFSIHI